MALAGTVRRAIRTAFKALDDLAGNVTFSRIENSYDTATGVVTPTVTNYVAQGVFDNYRKDELDGQLIQVGDRRLFLLPNQEDVYEPTIGDKVADTDSVDWEVVRVTPIKPYNESFLYELQLRK